MTDLENKIQILTNSGYSYNFDRDIYCNFKKRKCFSLEFIEDNPIETIQEKISEPNPSSEEVAYYFDEPISSSTKTTLDKAFRKRFKDDR